MQPQPGLSVADAAGLLGVSPQRVRAMIHSGHLDAAKIGDSWLVSAQAVSRLRRRPAPSGRPFAPHNAWALLLLASGEPLPPSKSSPPPSPWMRWYLANRAAGAVWPDLAPRLRSRASIHRLRAHPSDLARLASEPQVVRTGVSAAEDHAFDVAAPGILEAYLPASRLPALRKKYLLEPSDSPNVLLHVVESGWPFAKDRRVAPPLIAALDLLDSGDERSQRAARHYFATRTTP